jgi:hypothetical protein
VSPRVDLIEPRFDARTAASRNGTAPHEIQVDDRGAIPFAVMKILRAVLLAVLLAAICAACGGGNGPNPSPTTYGSAAVSLI